MAVNSVKTDGKGNSTEKSGGTEFQSSAGSMNILSSAIHNHIKNTVESNVINFGLINSIVRGSVETNGATMSTQGNLGKYTFESSFHKMAAERYWRKHVTETGAARDFNMHLTDSTTKSVVSKLESVNINLSLDRSYTQHLGERFTITIPPYFDMAIIDASKPKNFIRPITDVSQAAHSIDNRYAEKRSTKDDMITPPMCNPPNDTNYINLDISNFPHGALDKLRQIPEWEMHEAKIIGYEQYFNEFLLKDASPKVPGFPEHFVPFKGPGFTQEQAKDIGATCRLQVSHGANQTIMISSHSLRTIRFNGATSIDHCNNNQLYLGGKYEHIRGRSTKLVEGRLVQHHRRAPSFSHHDKVKPEWRLSPKDSMVSYRFEDEASFATVEATEEKLKEVWVLQLANSGIDIGKVDAVPTDTLGMRMFSYGLSVKDDELKISHDKGIAMRAEHAIVFACGRQAMRLNKNGISAGDFFIRSNRGGSGSFDGAATGLPRSKPTMPKPLKQAVEPDEIPSEISI